MHNYLRLLRDRSAALVCLANLLAATGIGAYDLAVILYIRSVTGSLTWAGIVGGALTVGNAVGLTWQGQLLDRLGARLLIPVTGLGCAAAGWALTVVPADLPAILAAFVRLLAIASLSGFAGGLSRIGATGYAASVQRIADVGLLLSAAAVGGIVGGLAYGARSSSGRWDRHLRISLAVAAGIGVLLIPLTRLRAQLPTQVFTVVAVLFGASGLSSAPGGILTSVLVDSAVPVAARSRGYAAMVSCSLAVRRSAPVSAARSAMLSVRLLHSSAVRRRQRPPPCASADLVTRVRLGEVGPIG